MVEAIGIDHIYVTVSDLTISEAFYDKALMQCLGFRKNQFAFGEDAHVQYYNKHFGFVLRPARVEAGHQPYAPGLHHFCFRVDSQQDVQAVAEKLREQGIQASNARLYPEYAEDYVATFFNDPDGLKLEITNYRQERRTRHDDW